MSGNEAPPFFRVTLVDDAMAPIAPAGTECHFVLRDPRIGDAVLVRDASGGLHFRRYAQRIGGGFVAHAENPAYADMDSQTHGLVVIAVFDGLRAGWAQLGRNR